MHITFEVVWLVPHAIVRSLLVETVSVPAEVVNPENATLVHLVDRHLEKNGDIALFSKPDGSDGWVDVSARDFAADAKLIARGLMHYGVKPGDRVALMSATRYEWSLVDFAIAYAGGISVPIYETSSPSQVAWILKDSGSRIVIVENSRHAQAVKRAKDSESLSEISETLVIDEDGLDKLRAAGENVSEEQRAQQEAPRKKTDIATIIYTSGTTGKPKGCELTHANFVDLSDNAAAAVPGVIAPDASTILFLPLAHVFARFIALMAVGGGARTGHTSDLKNLLPALDSFKPTFLLVVPRVFEKVFNGAQQKAEDGGKGKIFARAAKVAEEYSRQSLEGKVSLSTRVKHKIFDVLVYKKLRAAMGGKVTHAVSGGSALGERLGHFFNGIGLTVLEGFGATETAAPVTVNTPEKIKIGTVGRPVPGNEIKLGEDGEILVKGVCVFKGYYNREDLTEDAFVDGWYATGDLGTIDEDGFLTITGRKKEILVTASGKNVAPGLMEDRVRSVPIVSQCVVVGEGRPYVGALVTVDEEALPGWLERHNLPADTKIEDLVENKDLLADIQEGIDSANDTVSRAESIRKFRVLTTDLTEETGHLTPSLKIRRQIVLKDFQDEVEKLYKP
ncbi:AMP-dependent synthetase/ligase [Pseudoglutamicibacter albus]|uniref:AMP-dependent synthetase/ligase n=1 Tax=Pseudoglutamicibacter albus TaxID=98671 RepID=UPI001EF7140E|nr:AMP-dependent synthetase/ligase [Pseudoglutamicibacter albus]MCG7304798.1 AMP-dependent synthetase/ligase [Pseudoglutamicibacter albus]